MSSLGDQGRSAGAPGVPARIALLVDSRYRPAYRWGNGIMLGYGEQSGILMGSMGKAQCNCADMSSMTAWAAPCLAHCLILIICCADPRPRHGGRVQLRPSSGSLASACCSGTALHQQSKSPAALVVHVLLQQCTWSVKA